MTIRETILKDISMRKTKFKTSDLIKASKKDVSRQFVSSILNELVKKEALVREGTGRYTFYALPQYANTLGKYIKKRLRNKSLEEHKVLETLKAQGPFLTNLKENVAHIFDYAFTEMLNNAIEHSKSKYIEIEVCKDTKRILFTVRDFGVGVFRNVRSKRKLTSELEAAQDLLKGKTTTKPREHSGEGIYFTSKAADIFILESFNYGLRIDNTINDVFIEEVKPAKKGTKVSFSISLNSRRHLSNIFRRSQTSSADFAFDKTEIKIKLFTLGTIYISRSQARRVSAGLEKFKSIIFDFDKVPSIGQAFSDEIFRVFQKRHPEITIKPINMNKAVKFIVERVKNL